MGNIGGGEILLILLVALLVLGPDKLPEVARQVGKAVGEMRKISSGFQRELQDAIRVDEQKPAGPAIPPAEATDTFLTTEPAALTEPTAVIDEAALVQSVEPADTNDVREPAPVPGHASAMTDTADTADITSADPADTFLTTEPAALVETPPEAPPLPSDAALGGDR